MTEAKSKSGVKQVVAGIFVDAGSILCCQRSQADPFPFRWEFPGGKIEAGETPVAALVRELEEELGVQATVGPLVATVRHEYAPGMIVELQFFRVDSWRGKLENRIFHDIRWVTRSELEQLDFLEADRGLVADLAAGRKL